MKKYLGLVSVLLSVLVNAEINFEYSKLDEVPSKYQEGQPLGEYHFIKKSFGWKGEQGAIYYYRTNVRPEIMDWYGREYKDNKFYKRKGRPYKEYAPFVEEKINYENEDVSKTLYERNEATNMDVPLSQGPAQDDYWGCLHERPLFKIHWPNLKKIETAETDRQNSEYAVLITGDGDGGNMGGPVTGATNSLYMNIIDHSGVIVTKEPMLNVSYASYPLIDYELESEFFFDAYGIPIGSNREDLIPEDNIDLGAGRKGYGKLFAQDFNENGQQDLIFWHRIYKSHKAVKDPKTKEWDTSKRYFDFEREWFTWYEEDSTQDGFTEHKLTTEQAKQWLSDNQLGWNDGYPKDNSQCKYEGVRKIPMMTGVYDPELKPYQK
jgi:hypothetical protein